MAATASVASREISRAADWRDEIPDSHRGPLRLWFWSVAAMTFAVLVVGGITRLTLSGLSIVDWHPVMGVIPPLSDAQWQQAFERYQQFPDYTWRQDMGLSEFKFIYFWEWLHRLLARTIGLVFLIPFVVFTVKGWLPRPLMRRALVLFGLGGMQGLMGWLMVMSGLVDRPSVSHYRLAAHLSLAFLIFGLAVWLARELKVRATSALDRNDRRVLVRGLGIVGVLLALQVVWGAFVAGLKAGKIYPTFPLMGGRLVPGNLLEMDSTLLNFIANPAAVQWVHRVIGTLLTLSVIGLFVTVRRRASTLARNDAGADRYSLALLGMVIVQYALGVATLLMHVPVSLGVIHQSVAMILFGVWLAWLHQTLRTPVRAGAT